MQEIGTVISTEGKKARVLINRHAACGECGACQIGREKMTMETTAQNDIKAKPGDSVLVEMQFMNVLEATGIAYGIPLLGFLLGAIIGWFLAPSFNIDQTLLAFCLGLFLTVLVYVGIFMLEKYGIFNLRFQPHITSKTNLPLQTKEKAL